MSEHTNRVQALSEPKAAIAAEVVHFSAWYSFSKYQKHCSDVVEATGESYQELSQGVSPDWIEGFRAAESRFVAIAETRRKQFQRLDACEREMKNLRHRVDELTASQPFTAFITTFAPEPFHLLRDIPVVVHPTGDDFTATLFDAGISASGDSDEEAVSNLKDIILAKFQLLTEMPADRLGKSPSHQLAVLRTLIAKD